MTENLAELISDSLSNVIDIRGSHVHSHRYTDEDLRRLSLLQNLSDDEEGEAFLEAYRLIYRETRDTWSKRITSNNDATEQLLDICSQRLYSTLFAEDGQFVFPDDR
jgi:predicted ATP-binding protein involved in virulence